MQAVRRRDCLTILSDGCVGSRTVLQQDPLGCDEAIRLTLMSQSGRPTCVQFTRWRRTHRSLETAMDFMFDRHNSLYVIGVVRCLWLHHTTHVCCFRAYDCLATCWEDAMPLAAQRRTVHGFSGKRLNLCRGCDLELTPGSKFSDYKLKAYNWLLVW
jgi:hypothetical protein